MDLGIKGKKALVTGASSGLGEAVAMALASEGADVVINSRSEDRLREAADRIERTCGTRPRTIVADLANTWDIPSVVQSAGDIDILVSNAGGPPPGLFLDLDPEKWSASASLTLDAAVALTRAVLPSMIKKGWGRLIYITSLAVLQPLDDLILSNTYRAGVTGFCKTIANTYGKNGITANCVCPGYTATERLQHLAQARAEAQKTTPDQILKGLASSVPVGRVGMPEEFAAVVAFLASLQAAYINGSSIAVDGGARKSLI